MKLVSFQIPDSGASCAIDHRSECFCFCFHCPSASVHHLDPSYLFHFHFNFQAGRIIVDKNMNNISVSYIIDIDIYLCSNKKMYINNLH